MLVSLTTKRGVVSVPQRIRAVAVAAPRPAMDTPVDAMASSYELAARRSDLLMTTQNDPAIVNRLESSESPV